MARPPRFDIDPVAFNADPYPALAKMRGKSPIVYVPQLEAVLLTRRDDVFHWEKQIDVFSSLQPGGLMTELMGENMMRKDGEAHQAERKAIFPSVSPRTVRDVWTAGFRAAAQDLLDDLRPRGQADLVEEYAKPLSGHALRAITGLTNMTWDEMDRVSQGMIDGISNYAGDPAIRAYCNDCTASIDAHIDARLATGLEDDDLSLLAVQTRAGLSDGQTRANIKLAISGGQNEPRDAIAGAAWTLLTHPDQLAGAMSGDIGWDQVFAEYTRWISPIGMSPRRIARDATICGAEVTEGSRGFLMFGSANRDPAHFTDPDRFDARRDTGPAIPFGAGPHFCAGAWASRALIADVALPMLFATLPGLRLTGPVEFSGWAFRGPLSVPVRWDV